MFSFLIILFMLAMCFNGVESVTLDTWVIVFAISVSTDVQIFRWISKK